MSHPQKATATAASTTKASPVIGDWEEDSVLDISEQTNRPKDSALYQQRIPAWNPILDPVWVIIFLFYMGIVMVPVGLRMYILQRSVVEVSIKYDDYHDDNPLCGINTTFNANRTCLLEMDIPQDMEPPVLLYYQINNFHQNHRSYYQSYDVYQLAGNVKQPQQAMYAKKCHPLNKLGNITLNPCGMIANTFFNDKFSLIVPDEQEIIANEISSNSTMINNRDALGNPLVLIEDGIAWRSDVEYMYKQPEGFQYGECPDQNACDETCCSGFITQEDDPDPHTAEDTSNLETWSCKQPWRDPASGTCYRYYYPNDDTTQYLYETYPNMISPLEGVTNEHFIVWMRVAPSPQFRKLYGWIDQPILKGTKLLFEVQANWVVETFQGSKTLVLSTTTIFGGKSNRAAYFFLASGIFCFAAGLFFLLKHTFRPRRLADKRYLQYKQE